MVNRPSTVLASAGLFAEIEADALKELSRVVEPVRIAGGSTLFRQDASADCLYVVSSGRLRASVEAPDGSERVLGELGPGDTVGEMSILTGEPRSATVRALRDSQVLRLSASAFNELVGKYPAMMMQVTRCIVDRYRSIVRRSGSATRTLPRTIAIIPTNPDVPLSEFTKRLELAFGGIASVVRLTSDSVDAVLGTEVSQTPPDHARSHELADWLMQQEAQHRIVLYESDLVPSQWTGRCLRQADRVLIVGVDGTSHEVGPIEVLMNRERPDHMGATRELAILHRTRAKLYPGTSEWLSRRSVERHHHIVLDGPTDFDRLVRMFNGTALGLVLGGGGCRCFTQIGVIRAMREAGMQIDMVGGTSMGAFIAAQLAFGMEPDEMEAFNTRLWSKLRPLSQYTIPFVGLTAPNSFVRVTRETYGNANIEDFGIPMFCCSSNITKAKLMVLDRGPIWFSLAASIAVPGIAPPMFHSGDLLVDGAVLDNLPIDVMRARCDGKIIAVDVSPVEDLHADPVYVLAPSTWQILGNRLNPFAQKIALPSILEILSRCSTLTSVQQTESLKRMADLFIHPPTEAYSMFAWDSVHELSEVGYTYSAPVLSAWRNGDQADGSAPPRRRRTAAIMTPTQVSAL